MSLGYILLDLYSYMYQTPGYHYLFQFAKSPILAVNGSSMRSLEKRQAKKIFSVTVDVVS